MKKLAILATASLIIAGAGTAVMADTPFSIADANGDYQITMAEAMGAFPRLTVHQFGLVDTDGDGSLDEGQFYLLGALGAD